ncbi:MAG: hypothetical protein AAGA55_01880 [Planctomycetota bacterium]
MPTRRLMSLGVLSAVTVPWALAMSVLGLWLIAPGSAVRAPGILGDARVAGALGCSAFACGQVVFMVCVCDRVFPRASRRLTALCEGSAGVVFAGALIGLGVWVVI